MKMRCNWGTGVAATYALFVLATTGFVAFAMGRPVSLVREDYYAESLRQDSHTRAIENASGLGAAMSVATPDAQHLSVSIPAALAPRARGTVTFYRAADPNADRVIEFVPDSSGRQVLSTAGMARGQWLVQLRWTTDAHDYYYEQPLVR